MASQRNEGGNMESRSLWSFVTSLAFGLIATHLIADPVPQLVRGRVAEFHYEVNEEALPLNVVQLFVTTDRGKTWRLHGTDEDRHSPLLFQADGEGVYGFCFVVMNASGASSPPPTEGIETRQWIMFDWTPPVVQLHESRQTTNVGQRVLQIRWTAVDANFPVRPIDLQYRRESTEAWQSVTPEPLANTSRFDWRIPDEIKGSISLRVLAMDEVGHSTSSPPEVVELLSPASPAPIAPRGAVSPGAAPRIPEQRAPSSRERADKLFDEAVALRDAKLDRESISRFREVVRLDPHRSDALVEMGGLLYRHGDLERADAAFAAALGVQPESLPALQGAARVSMARKDYKAAGEWFRAIVKRQPSDASTWMKLGDVAVFEGDEIVARECYQRAVQVDPSSTEVVAEAQNRLALMNTSLKSSASQVKR